MAERAQIPEKTARAVLRPGRVEQGGIHIWGDGNWEFLFGAVDQLETLQRAVFFFRGDSPQLVHGLSIIDDAAWIIAHDPISFVDPVGEAGIVFFESLGHGRQDDEVASIAVGGDAGEGSDDDGRLAAGILDVVAGPLDEIAYFSLCSIFVMRHRSLRVKIENPPISPVPIAGGRRVIM
jgi:hypothetical protein